MPLSLRSAIFGYNAKPTFVEVVSYCGYWIIAIMMACYKHHKRTLFDADFKHNRMLREQAKERAAQKEAELAVADAPVTHTA